MASAMYMYCLVPPGGGPPGTPQCSTECNNILYISVLWWWCVYCAQLRVSSSPAMLPTLGRTPPLLSTSPLPPRANAAEDDDELLDDELDDELDPPLPPHIESTYPSMMHSGRV